MCVVQSASPVRTDFRPCCETLLGPAGLGLLAPQVGRVLAHVAGEDVIEEVREAMGVVRIFKRHALIPPVLYEHIARGCLGTGVPGGADAAAVAFAACLFPQRVFRKSLAELEQESAGPEEEDDSDEAVPPRHGLEDLLEDELQTRLNCFWEVAVSLPRAAGVGASLWERVRQRLEELGRLPHGFYPRDFAGLIEDLSAFQQAPARQPADAEARCNGAALYLATCSRTVVARLARRWAEERLLLAFVRTHHPSPPSMAFAAPGDSPNGPTWSQVRERLMARGHSGHLVEAIIQLEQSAWKQARFFYSQHHDPPLNSVPGSVVEDFWQALHGKLCSGFPYFAFRSRLNHWWKQCVLRHEWPPILTVYEDATQANGHRASPSAHDEVSSGDSDDIVRVNELAFVREGYRLVRLSFFARNTSSPAGAPAGGAAPNHERVRAVVDVLFHRVLLADAEAVPPSFREVAREHDCTLSELNNWSHRLKQRLCAYTLARRDGRSIYQIHTALGPKAKGWLPVAALARVAPPERTLFWVLAGRLFLYPFLRERHQDPCDFKRFLREFWVWASDDELSQSLLASPHPLDQAVISELQRNPLARLWQEFRGTAQTDAFERYLEAHDFADERGAIWRLLRGRLGGALETCSQASFDGWCQVATPALRHWVIPVWHLRYVERVQVPKVEVRLSLDPADRVAVAKLAQAMRSLL